MLLDFFTRPDSIPIAQTIKNVKQKMLLKIAKNMDKLPTKGKKKYGISSFIVYLSKCLDKALTFLCDCTTTLWQHLETVVAHQ